MGVEGGPGLRSPPAAGQGAMEQVQMINIQRLLEAAEYLERRERGNGGRRGAGLTAPPGGSGVGVRDPHGGARAALVKGIGARVCWWAGGESPNSEGFGEGQG